jgi:hypothetical protein
MTVPILTEPGGVVTHVICFVQLELPLWASTGKLPSDRDGATQE